MTAPGRPRRPLSVQQCADTLGVSKMTVFRLIHSGALPAMRIGQVFRVPANELDRFMRGAVVVPDWAKE